MGNRIPLSGGRKMIPTREDLERLGFGFFAQGRRGRGGIIWQFYERFVGDDAAPVSSPRDCVPGPGQLYFVQTDGTQAISDGKHVFTAQSTPVWGDQGFRSTAWTRAAGLALVDTINLTVWEECGMGWHTSGGVVDPSTMEHAIKTNPPAGRLDKEDDTRLTVGLSAGSNYKMLLILRDVGCFYILDGKLQWVEDSGSTATLYPSFTNLDGAGTNDNCGVADLPGDNKISAWSTEFGVATDTLTTPAADETGAHEDDCIAYARNVSVPSAGSIRFDLRRSV